MHLRNTVPVLAGLGLLIGLAGCETQTVARVGEQPREAITYAATAKYPADAKVMEGEQYQIAALDNPRINELRLLNLTDTAIPASTLWVNRNYVTRIPQIPPRGTLTVDYVQLLEAGRGTGDLRAANQEAKSIQIQTQQGLIEVLGPARQ